MNLTPRDESIVESIPTMKQPACPRCRYNPLEFACNVVRTVAGHLVAVVWCGHCGHTLNVQFIGIDPPQIESPLIMRPS